MAQVQFNNSDNRFEIIGKGVRPAWSTDIKKWLLEDALKTRWIQNTTIAQLLGHYQEVKLNFNGVIEALERRHIISWENITIIYEEFMNVRVFKQVEREIHNAFCEVIKFLMGSLSYGLFDFHLTQRISANASTQELAKIFNDRLSGLNSSRNNLFIGPARQNRSIGQAHDTGGDLPREILQGRPYGTTVSNAIAIINGYFDAIGKPRIGQL